MSVPGNQIINKQSVPFFAHTFSFRPALSFSLSHHRPTLLAFLFFTHSHSLSLSLTHSLLFLPPESTKLPHHEVLPSNTQVRPLLGSGHCCQLDEVPKRAVPPCRSSRCPRAPRRPRDWCSPHRASPHLQSERTRFGPEGNVDMSEDKKKIALSYLKRIYSVDSFPTHTRPSPFCSIRKHSSSVDQPSHMSVRRASWIQRPKS